MTRDQKLSACAVAIEREHGRAAFLNACFAIDHLDGERQRGAAKVWRELLKRLEALEGGGTPRQ